MRALQRQLSAAKAAGVFCIALGLLFIFQATHVGATNQTPSSKLAAKPFQNIRQPLSSLTSATIDLPFRNENLSLEERTDDLISRLTLKEKIGLLSNTAKAVPRLGLKSYEWWSEALHGVAFSPGTNFDGVIKCVTSFPQVIALGASFNRTLWNVVAQAISTEGRAMFNTGQAGLTFWAPNVNIFRDPRWGRGQETVGEDPLVASEYAAQFVLGMQGGESGHSSKGAVQKRGDVLETDTTGEKRDTFRGRGRIWSLVRDGLGDGLARRGRRLQRDERGGAAGRRKEPPALKVSACCKHFTAYDLEHWGTFDRHSFNANVTKQDLEDTYQPPFQSCVQSAGASCVMCAYNAINGVPACADRGLLTNTARREWSFDGYITSDCGAVADVINAHHYTATPEDTCNVTLSAGMDLNCGSFLSKYAQQAVARGALAESTIDRAVRNLVNVQMRLGLFDSAKGSPWGHLGPADVATPAHKDLALDAARQGIVLLVNKNGTLPLSGKRGASVAVIGPHIDAGEAMQGNYYGPACHVTTPLAALRSSGLHVLPSPGCQNVSCADTSLFADAVRAASRADVAVLFVGLDQSEETEGKDRVSLRLPGRQIELIKQVAGAAKRPVIVVILSGGPVDVADLVGDANVGALLWAGYPGQAGGAAIADVLLGRYNPSGRLPVTWYPEAFAESVPMTDMGMRPDPGRGYPGRSYRFYTPQRQGLAPIFEFGHGLSYSRFKYSGLKVSKTCHDKKVGSETHMQMSGIPKTGTSAILKCLREACVELSDDFVRGLKQVLLQIGVPKLLRFAKADGHPDRGRQRRFKFSLTVENKGDHLGQEMVLLFASPPEQAVREEGAALQSLIAFDKVELAPGERRRLVFTISPDMDLSIVDCKGRRQLWPGEYMFKVGGLQEIVHVGSANIVYI